MSFLNKKINPEVFNLSVGVILILFGAKILSGTKLDPLRDTVRIFMEIVPFIIIIFFGLLLSIKAIRNIKRQKDGLQNINNDKLGVTTKTLGTMTLVAILIFLIPVIFVAIVIFNWH